MKEKNFKFLEHTADVKFRAFGGTKEEAYKNSFLALMKSIYGDLKIKSKTKKIIKVSGEDDEALLYDFLEEFLFLLDSENFLSSEIKKIKIKNKELIAEVYGDSAEKYVFTNNVKAVTYNQMFVKCEKGKWVAQVVLDV